MDFEYLSSRYDDELQRAAEAESDVARDAHLALAQQYLAEMERMKGGTDPNLGLATG